MKLSQYFKFRLPQRRIPEENDPADINDLTYNFVSLDSIAKNHADELIRLEADKATKAALAAHEGNKQNPHEVTKSQLGLSKVDNISSMNMPVSIAQQAALDLREPIFSKNTAFNKSFGNSPDTVCEGSDNRLSDPRPASDVSNWAKAAEKPAYTKSEIGLPNADDTADINKPLSIPQKKYVDDSIGAAGGGDMLKSVYDQNNDGIVDTSNIANCLKGSEW